MLLHFPGAGRNNSFKHYADLGKRGVRSIVGVFLTFVAGMCLAATCDDEVSKLIWLEYANPEIDAAAAVKEGNNQYIAVYGFTLIIPGLSNDEYIKARELENYKIIDGTTDSFCSERHHQLNQVAVEYATVYNRTIGERL